MVQFSYPYMAIPHNLSIYFLFFRLFIYLLVLFWPLCMTWHVGPSFPNQGLNPCPLQWKFGLLTTGPPGKSLSTIFTICPLTFGFAFGSSLVPVHFPVCLPICHSDCLLSHFWTELPSAPVHLKLSCSNAESAIDFPAEGCKRLLLICVYSPLQLQVLFSTTPQHELPRELLPAFVHIFFAFFFFFFEMSQLQFSNLSLLSVPN